jgi:hypothetical protein
MFHATHGVFQTDTEGIFCATEATVPDELRVVVASALAPTTTVHVRVLTSGVSNDVHDYHNQTLLSQRVVASLADAEGTVAATVTVESVTVAAGTFYSYKLTLARAMVPTEITSVSVLSPYVAGTMATTTEALVVSSPRVELAVALPVQPAVPWAPSAAAGVTAPAMPAGHKLVVGSAVALRFAFVAPEPFGAGAAASFAATVNGTELSLASATSDGAALSLAYTASSVTKHTFVFVAFGTVFVFVVEQAQVYAFPTIVATSRSVPVVTLGSELVVTSSFDSAFPGAATATAVVTPSGRAPLSLAASVSGTSVSVAHTVAHDVAHSGVITVAYGSTSQEYAWGSGALTAASIYTFPSAFAYSADAFGTGLSVRQGVTSALTLTFSGGDVLHSSVIAAQVEYVKYTQGSSESDASISACSDPLETVDVALTPQATTDLVLRVKLRGPDGTLSGEITRVVPSAEIAPDWLPTSISSVGSDVPAPHKLVVGSTARLAFTFASNGDMNSAALSEITMYVDGTPVSLASATVSGRTLSLSYTATSIASRAFEFRSRGMSSSAVVAANEVYAFPSVVSTARSTSIVTLGGAVGLTTSFGAALPALMTASMRITPFGLAASTVPATPSVSEVTASYTVASDVAHSALVSLVYGPATQDYAWSTSALTAAEIYTFPSSFTVSGWLQQLTSRALTLTFTGGDGLHSSIVTSQVAYVRYTQASVETTVSSSTISCSSSAATVTLGSVTPAALSDVVLRVALRAPDGTVGPELSRTILAGAIAPQWVPTAAGSVTSNVSSAHKLVVGSEVQLTFSFVTGGDFPSTDASSMFSLRVDGIVASLTGAVVGMSARTVRIAYTATSAASVTYEFTTAYGSSTTFSVPSSEVYAFPTMSSTTRGVSVVSVGQTLALTSSFSASLPSDTMAAVSIVPTGYAAVEPAASVSGSSVTYSVSVAYDVVHTGTVTLSYGAAQRAYSWAAGTLTAAHIYTFPSAFTYNGTANGYGTGIHLKEGTAGSLALTFTGGDLLHSSVVSTQVEYVKFAQSGVETTIASASLACSDPLETVTVASITPASTADLTLKVKLRGPDGALSSEITAIVPSAQIVAAVRSVASIYNINARTRVRTSGFSSDSSAGSLLVAIPCDSQTEVSSQINAATSAKTVTWRSGYFNTSTSRYYGTSYTMRTQTTPLTDVTSFVVSGFSTPLEAYLNADFTLEMWIRPTTNYQNADANALLQTGVWPQAGQIQAHCDVAAYSASNLGRLTFYNRIAGVSYYTTRALVIDTWSHIALVRSGSTFTVYINGVSCASFPAWTMQSMTQFCVGGLNWIRSGDNFDFHGGVQDVRMYSTAKYTGAFTVPSATYTAVTTLTSLLDTTTGIAPVLVGLQTTPCRVTVSGGSYDMNIASDFTVFFVAAGSSLATIQATTAPYDCVVSSYDAATGVLTFAATPGTSGSVVLVVRVLSGSGSGALAATLTLAVASVVTQTNVSFALASYRSSSFTADAKGRLTPSPNGTTLFNGLGILRMCGTEWYPFGYFYRPSPSWVITDASYGTEGAIGAVVNRVLVGDFTVVLSFAQNYTSFGMGWKASPDIRDFEHHPTYQDVSWQTMWTSPWGFVGIGGSGGGYTTIGAYNVETGYNQEGVGPYPVRWYRYMRSGTAVSIAVSTSSAAGPWTVHASGTISNASDKVLCMIGHAGRRCSDPARIISVTN